MSSSVSHLLSETGEQRSFSPKAVTFTEISYTFLMMVWRDILIAGKQFSVTVILLLLQPALLLFTLGRVEFWIGAFPASFADTLLAGILGTIIMTVSIQSVSAPLINEFSYTREIDDRLLSPLPTWLVGAAKLAIGLVQSCLCCLLYFPLAWLILGPDLYHPVFQQIWLFAGALLLSSLMMSTLGLLIGSVTSGAQANAVLAVLLMPITFLGCVYYPWESLSGIPVLQYFSLLDPLTYISEMFRGTMTAQPHMNLLLAFGCCLLWLALFLFLGLRAFVRKAAS